MSLRLLVGPIALSLAVATLGPTVGASPGAAERAVPDRGSKSTWTEADKTGFGTARTRGSNVWFTLQGGRVSEVFYPDLSTPSVRSLELVVDGRTTFTDRESDGRRRGRPRVRTSAACGSSRSAPRHPGRYRITKTYVTDPRARRRSSSASASSRSTAAATGCTPLHDPALANDGMDDRGRTDAHGPGRHRRKGRRDRAGLAAPLRRDAAPASSAATTAGPTSRTTSDLDDGTRAARPGQRRAGRPDRRRDRAAPVSSGHARARLRAAPRRAGASAPPGQASARAPAARRALRPRLAPLPRRAEGRAGQRGRRTPPVPRLGARARRRGGQAEPGRVRRLAVGAVGVGRRGAGPVVAVGRLPPGVVARRLPVRHRAVGDGRQGRGPPDRSTGSSTCSRSPTAPSRRTPTSSRHAGLVRAPARRGRAADRARPPGRPRRTRRPSAACSRRRTSSRASATRRRGGGRRTRPQERWENQSGYSPELDRHPDRRSGLRRRHRPQERRPRARRGGGWRSPTAGSRKVKHWTVTSNGPLSATAPTSCG